jgi:hypothetical protein
LEDIIFEPRTLGGAKLDYAEALKPLLDELKAT